MIGDNDLGDKQFKESGAMAGSAAAASVIYRPVTDGDRGDP